MSECRFPAAVGAVPGIDIDLAVVDWVIDYPESAAVFEEFSLDYCCAGKSLKYACAQAQANLAVVCAKLRVIKNAAPHTLTVPDQRARPPSYWTHRTPPGWISRYSAATADPLSLAAEICQVAQAVSHWLRLPEHERWDTFQLQSLSAALFNRYATQTAGSPSKSQPAHVGLLQLTWPPGTEAIQCCLAELQQMLVAPLAVYKAVRIPLRPEDCPSTAELKQAEAAIVAQRDNLATVVARLSRALQERADEKAGQLGAFVVDLPLAG